MPRFANSLAQTMQLSSEQAREVADPDLRPAELANLFELHLFGARLLAQLTSVYVGPGLPVRPY
jgi:hypothetical protein